MACFIWFIYLNMVSIYVSNWWPLKWTGNKKSCLDHWHKKWWVTVVYGLHLTRCNAELGDRHGVTVLSDHCQCNYVTEPRVTSVWFWYVFTHFSDNTQDLHTDHMDIGLMTSRRPLKETIEYFKTHQSYSSRRENINKSITETRMTGRQ